VNLLTFVQKERLTSFSEERQMVESLKTCHISYLGIKDIILLCRGFKTAVDVVVQTRNAEELEHARKVFASLNFFFTEGMRQYPVFYLSMKENFAIELKALIDEQDENLCCRRVGELSGFPETAINAYEEQLKNPFEIFLETTQSEDPLTKNLKFSVSYRFAAFRLSRKHLKEELEIAQKWACEIWRVAPEIFFQELEEIPLQGRAFVLDELKEMGENMKREHLTVEQIPQEISTGNLKEITCELAEKSLCMEPDKFLSVVDMFSCRLPDDFLEDGKYSQAEKCVILINMVVDVMNEIDKGTICF